MHASKKGSRTIKPHACTQCCSAILPQRKQDSTGRCRVQSETAQSLKSAESHKIKNPRPASSPATEIYSGAVHAYPYHAPAESHEQKQPYSAVRYQHKEARWVRWHAGANQAWADADARGRRACGRPLRGRRVFLAGYEEMTDQTATCVFERLFASFLDAARLARPLSLPRIHRTHNFPHAAVCVSSVFSTCRIRYVQNRYPTQ